jgi:hypothetical protein
VSRSSEPLPDYLVILLSPSNEIVHIRYSVPASSRNLNATELAQAFDTQVSVERIGSVEPYVSTF